MQFTIHACPYGRCGCSILDREGEGDIELGKGLNVTTNPDGNVSGV
jgi:hypothetical protein